MIPGFFAAAGRHSPPVPIEQTPFYSGDLMTTSGWETVTWPGAFYDPASNRTFVTWQFVGAAGHKGARVAAFDHATGTWSRPHTAGTFYLPNDDHGHPALVRDADGYIHCFFGSHNNSQGWSVTASPDDITEWEPRPAIVGGEFTYPKPVRIGNDLHLLLRDRSRNMGLVVRKMTPSGGEGAWGAVERLVDFGGSNRVYTTEPHAIGSTIHFCCTYADGSDSVRRGVYYFVYDPTAGSLSNFDGSVTVPAVDLPVEGTVANANFRIFDHGSRDGDVASLQFDSLGNAHVMFADGGGAIYELKHMALISGDWTSPVVVGEIEDQSIFGYVDTYALVPGAAGRMEAWYHVGGDRVMRARSTGGTWSPESVIAVGDGAVTWRGSAVRNSQPLIRTIFSDASNSANDSTAEHRDLYVHGDSGFIGAKVPESADPHWGDVSLLIVPGRVGGQSALEASSSCLPVSLIAGAEVSSEAPFPGARSIRTGSGDYFSVPQNQAISTGGEDDFCFDVWFKLHESPSGRLQAVAASRVGGFALLVNESATLQFLLWSSNTVRLNLIGTGAITAGRWYLASVERAATAATLYLDGVVQAAGSQSEAPSLGLSAVNFGRDPQQTGRHLDGWICEPRFTRAARYGGTSFTPVMAPWPR